jgi:hypothetical protein
MAIAIILSNGRTWKTKVTALGHFKVMLARYADAKVVEDRNDHDDIVALLERYDEAIVDGPSKTGAGIDHFTRTRNNFNGYSTPSFWVHRTNGTATDFSYISGVNGQAKGYSREFYDACRAAVQDDLIAAKHRFFAEHGDERGSLPCEITAARIGFEDAHLDHDLADLRPDRGSIPWLNRHESRVDRARLLLSPKTQARKINLTRRAEVRHRPPYQTRHTYACWNLTARGNLAFIANQMGHNDYSMLVKIYGRWIDSESPESWGASGRA